MGVKVGIVYGHPAHVHFFDPIITDLEAKGIEVQNLVRSNNLIETLLQSYGHEYSVLTSGNQGAYLPVTALQTTLAIRRYAELHETDLLVAIGGQTTSIAGKILGIPTVTLTDTETLANLIPLQLSSRVIMPSFLNVSRKKVRNYNGHHEFAYLRPEAFEADFHKAKRCGIEPNRKNIIIRVSSMRAHHDLGKSQHINVPETVKKFEDSGAKVHLLPENNRSIPEEIKHAVVNFPPDKIHDVLAAADLYIGTGSTTALESASLGTPAIYIGPSRLRVLDALSEYGLIFQYAGANSHEMAISKALDLYRDNTIDWGLRRQRYIQSMDNPVPIVCNEIFDLLDL